ncbi:MAG: phosphotransferase [Planctomycetota bacterium]
MTVEGAAELRDALQSALASGEVREGRPVRVEGLEILGDFVMSRVFAGREADRPVVVKAVKPRADLGDHLMREWRVLRALRQAVEEGDLPAHVAPEPIAVIDDPPAVVLSRMPGRRLDASMSAAIRFPWRLFRMGSLVRDFDATVRSLAAVAAVLSARPPVVDAAGESLSAIAARQRADGAWDGELEEGVLELAVALGTGAPEGGFKHGNFAPWNVVVGPEGAAVIDFQETERPGTWLDDIAQMMIHLEIAGAQGGLKPGQVRTLCAALFRSAAVCAEENSLPTPDEGALNARYLHELCRMHSWYTAAAPEGSRQGLRPRADAVGFLVRRFVESGGSERPWS